MRKTLLKKVKTRDPLLLGIQLRGPHEMDPSLLPRSYLLMKECWLTQDDCLLDQRSARELTGKFTKAGQFSRKQFFFCVLVKKLKLHAVLFYSAQPNVQ